MKRILFILLLTIPFIGFGQNLNGTGWKISENDGDQKIIIFENDGTFSYLNVKMDSPNEGKLYNDITDTWELKQSTIIISFTDGFLIKSGKINKTGDYMWGTWVNQKKNSGTWSGELIKF